MRTRNKLLEVGVSAALLLTAVAGAAPPPSLEYEVKAAFLYNLAVLTEWPTNTWAKPDEALVIGVLGDDPFGPALEKVLAGKTVLGRPIQLRRFGKVTEVEACHVLFISAAETDHWPALCESLTRRPMLTVSDMGTFCRRGGMVRLAKRTDDSIGLQINPGAAERVKLKLSSRLLALAKIQPTEP